LAKTKKSVKSKKRKTNWVSKIVILLCFLFVGFLVYQYFNVRRTRFVDYKEFGIKIPVNFSIHGIDVSHHQGTINWPMVGSMNVNGIKVSFAFMKATEGTQLVDSEFATNWGSAKRQGITRGAYHFFNEYSSGKAQAEHFIKTVGSLQRGDLPPVLDLEQNRGAPNEQLIREAKIWMDIVERHFGVKPIIYTYVSFYKEHLGNHFEGYPFWVAHYKETREPAIDRQWQIWQHSEDATISGINTKVDFNSYKGDIFTFKALLVP
jgi:lysozyme